MGNSRTDAVICLVDDDPDDRKLFADAAVVAGLPARVVEIEDGDELMAYLYREGDFSATPLPQVIVLDMNLPGRTGLELLAEIRGHGAFRDIPVLVLSTSHNDDDVRQAYRAGANSFITKPATFEKLIDGLRNVGVYWFNTVTLPARSSE